MEKEKSKGAEEKQVILADVKFHPFQITHFKDRDIYVLQKMYWAGAPKYQKVGFKPKEIRTLAMTLSKVSLFKKEFLKILKETKRKDG